MARIGLGDTDVAVSIRQAARAVRDAIDVAEQKGYPGVAEKLLKAHVAICDSLELWLNTLLELQDA